ncbi:hypothetical protein D9757_014583 [Collybiopsis confluens]|uniref:Uncharacterized protein n=1 Tax=Collybiopsis confluens TaxID=2823264 RepID=A0A8H5FQ30_9AGAR|nr:hypothetical protein D9757_014583 [Collybiopsis confluens]
MKLPDIFFKQLDEIMEGSDSETEVDYIARITMNSRGNSNQTGQKNDSRLGTAFTPPSTQLSRDLKLKTTGSSALRFQSPRNKPQPIPIRRSTIQSVLPMVFKEAQTVILTQNVWQK